MDSLIIMIVSLTLSLLCSGGFCLFFVFLIVGIIVLRRRGKKEVSAKEAVAAGVESVSQVFVRGKMGLEELDEDDDDE